MHRPSLVRKKEDDTIQSPDEDIAHQDRLAKVLKYHSKGFSQSEIAGKLNVNQSTVSRDLEEIHDFKRGIEEIPNTSIHAECAIEITGLEIYGRPWWTLALDSYGDYEQGYKNLSIAADQLLASFPVTKPKKDHSNSYPNWILKNIA